MKVSQFLLAAILLAYAAGCAQAEKSAEGAFSNIGSVTRTAGKKAWMEPNSGGSSAEQKEKEDESAK